MSKTCSDICSKYGQDKLRDAKDMARICPRCDQDMPNTLLIYAQDMLKIQIFPRYRVPILPAMCQKPEINRVPNWPPLEMIKSRTYHHQKMAESRTCHP